MGRLSWAQETPATLVKVACCIYPPARLLHATLTNECTDRRQLVVVLCELLIAIPATNKMAAHITRPAHST